MKTNYGVLFFLQSAKYTFPKVDGYFIKKKQNP